MEYLKLVPSPHIQLGEVEPLNLGQKVGRRTSCFSSDPPAILVYLPNSSEADVAVIFFLIRFKSNSVCQCQTPADV